MKKRLKNKNTRKIIVNNHNTKIHHKYFPKFHIMGKDLSSIYEELRPIYHELDKDFEMVDVVDLIYYERWLNG